MNSKRLFIFLFLVLIIVSNVFAYQLSPLSVSYSTTGADSVKAYTIVNDSDSPIAIQMVAYKRMLDKDGNEYTEPASQYFSIQPAKMIIKPQTTQIVRVQYKGPKTVSKELNFRIVAEQIAYSKGAQEATSGQTINFLFVYSTAAYVQPSKIIERIRTTATFNSDDTITVALENTGSVHQLLDSLSVTINGNDGSRYQMSDEEIKAASGKNLLTDSVIQLTIADPEELKNSSSLSAEASYNFSYK